MTTPLDKGRRIVGKERQALGQKLAARYEKGSSIRQLANLTGRSYGFVHRLLSESGLPLRGRGGGRPGSKRRAVTVPTSDESHARQDAEGLGLADLQQIDALLAVARAIDAKSDTLQTVLPERGDQAAFRGAIAALQKVRGATNEAIE